MKKTKKIFSIFLALMMIFSLVSCSNNKETIKESNVETKNKLTKKESQKEESHDSEYISDVVVVGGGGAGLVSALSAAEKDAKVIVLE